MMMLLKRFIAAGLLLVLVAGCSLFKPHPPASSPSPGNQQAFEARRVALSQFKDWRADARVSTDALLGLSAALNWQQQNDYFIADVSGPFGLGRVNVRGTEEEVEIRAKGKQLVTRDPDATFQRYMGWHIPFHQTRYWVLGLPAPETAYEMQLDGQGRVLSLQQSGWAVEYVSYQSVNNYQLPRKIVLENAAQDVIVKIILDKWQPRQPQKPTVARR